MTIKIGKRKFIYCLALFFIIYYGIAVKVADMLKHKSQKHLRENTGALCSRRSKRYRLINIK